MRKERKLITGFIGLALILYGELIPLFFHDWTLFIVENIHESITSQDSGRLLVTSFVYVAKYLLIFSLIYYGAMLLTHAFTKSKDSIICSLLFICIMIASLVIFNLLYTEQLSFQGHLLTIAILVLLKSYIPALKHFYFIFAIILFLVLLSMLWLQLIPALTPFGFGTNDIAVSIKIADSFFTTNSLLNTLATIFSALFLTIAIIFTFLIYLVNKQITTLKQYQAQEVKLEETRIALMESKVYEEINMLVHDLKTPLVTVEGLMSLIELKLQTDQTNTLADYFKQTDQSINKMKDMISEIIHENTKKSITINELLDYVTSHLCLDEQLIDLEINIEPDLPSVFVNKIRFARAISNIFENAITSFYEKAGHIRINVKRIDRNLLIHIKDNGPGIEQAHLEKIWKEGFSTTGSSGLGLSFVKRVVENHHGSITINSVFGNGTEITIMLPIQSNK